MIKQTALADTNPNWQSSMKAQSLFFLFFKKIFLSIYMQHSFVISEDNKYKIKVFGHSTDGYLAVEIQIRVATPMFRTSTYERERVA